ncbi:hypothetical protein [Mucilaginibacter sp. AK015]|uniref:hypothetical protein n=1 Tax=Mucilaginibacter sp. AK015 TaxID=2723072 RepID=UPI0016092B0A|nr:hypothetical protein [Mucilaginibacter sp. AK015]MBB5395629.1 4-alpha-glucanotransferase [Mucilaginibacter sp. AK015]
MYKSKTDKRITNGAVVQDNTYTDMNGASIQFNADNTAEVLTESGNAFTMQYTLSGDLLTYIHTESHDYYGSKEILRIKKMTSNELQLTYSPQDNEPALTPPDGFYSEMVLTR